MTATSETAAAVDPVVFAQALLGQPLWPHQADLLASPARYRVVCAGRQVGKSRALAVLALFEAATRRNVTVLLVSAGETASRRLLEECAGLAGASPLLRGSVLDESKGQLVLSTGSRILSVPASQRQIRGWPVDLLIVDEAAFIDGEIWRAAEPSIIARPGSRVVLCSTPWGGVDHFFRLLWRRGMDAPDGQVSSWHWPSSVSPLVDAALLEQIRGRESADYFAREFLAEWPEESGAYFTTAELEDAVADYELLSPARARAEDAGWRSLPAVAGVDWGVRQDANAVVLLSPLEDFGVNAERLGGGWAVFVPWLQARLQWPYEEFIDYLVDASGAYRVEFVVSELNGPGDYPTTTLSDRLFRAGLTPPWVRGVWTDNRRKQAMFGALKGLLQARRMVLPRHPELLKQLRGLEFEQLGGGGMRIAVPERAGHDDLAMALGQAVSALHLPALRQRRPEEPMRPREGSRTPGGLWVPARPLPSKEAGLWCVRPRGDERSSEAAW